MKLQEYDYSNIEDNKKIVSNPYVFNKPILDPKFFAGRKSELREIDYYLKLTTSQSPQYRNLAIMGSRGIGKTSLVNMLIGMAEKKYGMIISRVELNNELATNQAALFHLILEPIISIEREISSIGVFKQLINRLLKRTTFEVELNLLIGKIKAAERQSSQLPQHDLRKTLEHLFQKLNANGFPAIMVVIDEADLLAKNESNLQIIRNTFEQISGYIIVLAGTEKLFDNLSKVFSPIQRFFDQIPLGPLEGVDDVLDCLRSPLHKSEHYLLDERFASDIYAVTGGHPYLVKLMGYHTYQAAKINNWRRMLLSPSILDSAERQAQYSGLDGIEKRLEERRSKPFDPEEFDVIKMDDIGTISSNNAKDEDRDISLIEIVNEERQGGSVINLVNTIFRKALEAQATEVQLTLQKDTVLVRARIDGLMNNLMTIPSRIYTSVISRLKIMSAMDIAERRLPQDGRFLMKISGREVDCRVSITPTVSGEKAFIRFIDKKKGIIKLEDLGINPNDLELIISTITNPQGLSIVGGPRGSGKSTTLRALISHVSSPQRNVAAIEDHVEIVLSGVEHYQARDEIGLTFASLLRSLLRQSVDVILLEEIRDFETAEIAIKAAMSSSSIFTTISTLDAISPLWRLFNMGVEPFLIASAMQFSLGQRLIRKICEECKEQIHPDIQALTSLGFKPDEIPTLKIYQGVGCLKCNKTGYKGQIGLFELLVLKENIKTALMEGKPANELRTLARQNGMRTLREDGIQKIRDGLTTLEEVARTTS